MCSFRQNGLLMRGHTETSFYGLISFCLTGCQILLRSHPRSPASYVLSWIMIIYHKKGAEVFPCHLQILLYLVVSIDIHSASYMCQGDCREILRMRNRSLFPVLTASPPGAVPAQLESAVWAASITDGLRQRDSLPSLIPPAGQPAESKLRV